MNLKYRVMVRDNRVVEEEYFENICCKDMEKALLHQETPFVSDNISVVWLYCPFCKKEITY